MTHGSYRASQWRMGLPKLTAREAKAIFLATGTQREIARRIEISPKQVHAIKNKQEWR